MRPIAVMVSRRLSLLLVLGFAVIALLAACGGDGGRGTSRGQLTDPSTVPPATPWDEPPPIIFPEDITATPGGDGTPAAGQTPVIPGQCGDKYTVQAGDFPGSIAEKCGVDVQDLLEANPDVKPTDLHIGDVLNIPQ